LDAGKHEEELGKRNGKNCISKTDAQDTMFIDVYRSEIKTSHFGHGGWDGSGRLFLIHFPNKVYWAEDGNPENIKLRHALPDTIGDVRGFFIDSKDNIYVGTVGRNEKEQGGIYKSHDHGLTFTELNSNGCIGYGKCFWGFDEDEEGRLYLGVYWGENEAAEVWKSTDGGMNWENISDNRWKETRHVHNVRVDPKTGWLYASLGDLIGLRGVWRSKEKDGSDWVLKFGDARNRLQFVGMTFKNEIIYLGCDSRFSKHSIFRCEDDGTPRKINPSEIIGWEGWGVFYLEKDRNGRIWAAQRPIGGRGKLYTSMDGMRWRLRSVAEEEDISSWRKSHVLRDGIRGETGDGRNLFRAECDNFLPWLLKDETGCKYSYWERKELSTRTDREDGQTEDLSFGGPETISRTLKRPYQNLMMGVRGATQSIRILPHFLIIGGQRCGTTSLYNYIISHPRVFPAIKKEIHFFDLYFNKGLEWYRSHFPTSLWKNYREKVSGSPVITGEASPYYMFHPHAARRIAECLPCVKLIMILRNPVDRAYSHHQHEVRLGHESLSFEEALDLEEDRLRGEEEKMLANEWHLSNNYRHFSYLKRGIYIRQIKRLVELFLPGQILILENGELFKDPQKVLREVFNYLGVREVEPDVDRTYNVGRYPEMDKETRSRLVRFFKEPNEKLFRFLGKEYDWT
jgi:hypothetical protein